MTKWPKLPRGSMNPFERDGKFAKPEEKRAEENRSGFDNRGCGDPRCRMCYPDNQGRNAYRGPSAPRSSTGDQPVAMFNSLEEEYRRMRMREINSYEMREITRESQSPPAPPRDAKLKELRKPIEDMILTTPHDASWEDFIGNAEAKTAMVEAIEASTKHKEIYDFYGMQPSKGVVLLGPPGCGKTMLGKLAASALARLHGKAAEVLIMKDIESPFIGVTENKIAAIFDYAREYQVVNGYQLVIFVDEADTLFSQRGTSGNWKSSTVNAMLAGMDGIEANGAFVILASNRAEAIDEALMRDGRCSRKIKVVRPGYEEALKMVTLTLEKAPLADTREFEYDIAKHVVDYLVHPARHLSVFKAVNVITEEIHDVNLTLAHIMNGAMLTTLVERAKHYAFRRDIASGTKSGITMTDLLAAVDELVRDNKDLPHRYAMAEIMAELELREHDENAQARRKMN